MILVTSVTLRRPRLSIGRLLALKSLRRSPQIIVVVLVVVGLIFLYIDQFSLTAVVILENKLFLPFLS